MQGQYLYKYPVFICILPCCPGQYTNKSLPFKMSNQSKSYTSFDPAKHSENISPFNTNIEIYSATIENTVVSHTSCRLCVQILSLWIVQTSNSGTQHCLIPSQSRRCHFGKIFFLISRWPVCSIINLSEIPFSSPPAAVVALRL